MFVELAEVSEIPLGTAKRVKVQDKSIVIFNIDGEFYAFDDFCKEGADMTKAVVTGEGDLLCPFHGWRFDIKEGICTMVPECKVRKYDLKIEQGRILADLQ